MCTKLFLNCMKLAVKKIYEDAVLPTRAHADDAGMDLYVYGEVVLPSGSTAPLPTGVAMEIPTGCVGLIWDKSSIGIKGLTTLGGVIDASYRGEVKVVMRNLTDAAVTFTHGQKIAQMLIQKVELPEIEEVGVVSETKRGEGGFGSTGK